MVSSLRLLPLATLGLLLPISACVTTPRSTALNSPGLYRYCDPYAVSSGAYGRCYSGVSGFDYLGYGGYGSYGYPQAYGTASPLYGAYDFNRGGGGFGSYHFNDGYLFASRYSHGHPDFGFVPVGYWPPHVPDYFGQHVGHYGSYGSLRDDTRFHVGSPLHRSGIHHGHTTGHSRSSHGGRHH